MRRWLAATACVAVLGATAGCTGPPAGGDGDLTNGWGPPPAPTQWRPTAGTCFDSMQQNASLANYAPTDCRERHLTETFFVGNLTGASAAADANDGFADTAQTTAYAHCSREAAKFAGADWHTGRLTVQPVLPGRVGWAGGARWFRCDIAELAADGGGPAGRTGSLKNVLSGPAPMRLRCYNPRVSGEDVRAMTPIDCAKAHHAEFAGLWTAPDGTLAQLSDGPGLGKGCLSVIARFTGVPDDGDLRYRVGWLSLAPARGAWDLGDRAVQCYLWLADETIRGSYQGVGVKKLPIHYA